MGPPSIRRSLALNRPFGPGWALVGDAGYSKDPQSAHGITDALRDAELLARALDVGLTAREELDAALAGYERIRDDLSLPLFAAAGGIAGQGRLNPTERTAPPPETDRGPHDHRNPVDTSPAATVQRFLAALARRDFTSVAATLSENVWMRAMLVRDVHEAHDDATTIRALRAWFATAEDFDVHEFEQAAVAERQRVRWQFVLRPDWAPGTPDRIEQVGYLSVRLGRITRLDVVCTCSHPIP